MNSDFVSKTTFLIRLMKHKATEEHYIEFSDRKKSIR